MRSLLLTLLSLLGSVYAQAIDLQFAATAPLCAGGSNGSLTVLASNGTSPYSYSWSTGQTDPMISSLSAGVYSVTVTDAVGDSAVASYSLQAPAPLNAIPLTVVPDCGNGGSIALQVTGGTIPYAVIWNNGQYNGPIINNLPSGTYQALVSDANGCQTEVVVNVPGAADFQVSIKVEKASCVGLPNGVATAVVTGGSGSYGYSWSTGATGVPQITGLAAGQSVSVTVTDLLSGCTGIQTVTIGTHTQILLQVIEVDVACANDSTGTATANAFNGTAPYQFAWSVYGDTISGSTITGLTSGAYPVTVTDAQGCWALGVANVDAGSVPVAQFSVETLLCVGDSVLIRLVDASNGAGSAISSWQWTVSWGSGSVLLTGPNPTLNLPANSNGFVQLDIQTAEGCSDSQTGVFFTGQDPTISFSASVDPVDCSGGPVPITVIGDAAYVYQWVPNQGITILNNDPRTVLADPGSTTTYTVIASSGGCFDSLQIEIPFITPFEITAGNDTIQSCTDFESITVQVNPPSTSLTFTWYSTSGDSIASGPTAQVPVLDTLTRYLIVAVDSFGCSDTAVATVLGIGIQVDASILAQNVNCAEQPIQAAVVNLDPADVLTYLWTISPMGPVISDPNSSNPTITGAAGNYVLSVQITNQYGCTLVLSEPLQFLPLVDLSGSLSIDACDGLTVQFNNNSNVSGVWNFGDGASQTGVSVEHTYPTPGSYEVTFTPVDSCYLPFTTTIQVADTPAVIAAIQGTLGLCLGAATFEFTDLSQSSAGISNWQWIFTPGPQTSNEQNPTITVSQPGPVTALLIVTDVNNCRDTSDLLELQADIVLDTIPGLVKFCPGTSVELNPGGGIPGYTYNWSSDPADPSLDPTNPNPTVSPLSPTLYSAQVVNGICSVLQLVNVIPWEAGIVQASNDTVVCDQTPVQISASSPNVSSFEWSTNLAFDPVFSNQASVIVLPSDEYYYVRVLTGDGCVGLDSVLVRNGQPEVVPASAVVYICNEIAASLEVINQQPSDVLTYEWSGNLPPIANPTVSPTVPTDYSVVVTNQFGCKDTLTFQATPVNFNLGLTVDGDTVLVAGESTQLIAQVTGGGVISYSWVPSGSLNDPTVSNPIATPDSTTLYTVTVIDDPSGCILVDTVRIRVINAICEEPFVFVPKAFTPNNDGNNDFFRVRGADLTEVYFVVWNRWGEKVYETNEVEHQGWDGTFRGVASTPDAYAWYAKVRCGDGAFWEKKGNVTLLK